MAVYPDMMDEKKGEKMARCTVFLCLNGSLDKLPEVEKNNNMWLFLPLFFQLPDIPSDDELYF